MRRRAIIRNAMPAGTKCAYLSFKTRMSASSYRPSFIFDFALADIPRVEAPIPSRATREVVMIMRAMIFTSSRRAAHHSQIYEKPATFSCRRRQKPRPSFLHEMVMKSIYSVTPRSSFCRIDAFH